MEGDPFESQRGIDRLIFFTDAVVAIAITLLILPLVEIVTADAAKHPPVPIPTFIHENVLQMFAFVLSFAVIARLWMANHEILENVKRASPALLWLDVAWVFTVVVIPLPTEITAAFTSSELTVLIYISVATANTVLLFAMAYYLFRHPEMQTRSTSRVLLWGVGSNTTGFIIAFLLVVAFPPIGYYALLTPALTIVLDPIVKPRIARREMAAAKK
ncbi:MAG TPA: TMEM175 family protein [Galbitalea sp.]|jgi:uncharacterized membrane protein|nr:TMEM175 family protein [Galbitalea sp.]